MDQNTEFVKDVIKTVNECSTLLPAQPIEHDNSFDTKNELEMCLNDRSEQFNFIFDND